MISLHIKNVLDIDDEFFIDVPIHKYGKNFLNGIWVEKDF